MTEDRDRPETNRPLNAPERRPTVKPLLGVVGLIAVIALIFAVLTLVQHNT